MPVYPVVPAAVMPSEHTVTDGATVAPEFNKQRTATLELRDLLLGALREIQSRPLPYAHPDLVNPTTINLVSGTRTYTLQDDQDYVLQLPASSAFSTPGGIEIIGGRRYKLVGGEINIPDSVDQQTERLLRGIKIQGVREHAHIEGVLLSGSKLSEGLQVYDSPGATITVQNCNFGTLAKYAPTTGSDPVAPSDGVWHCDVIQVVGGVGALNVHGLSARTYYQGITLKRDGGSLSGYPNQIGRVNLSSIDIELLDTAAVRFGFLQYTADCGPVSLSDYYVGVTTGSLQASAFPDGTTTLRTNDRSTVDGTGAIKWPGSANIAGVLRRKPIAWAGAQIVDPATVGVGYTARDNTPAPTRSALRAVPTAVTPADQGYQAWPYPPAFAANNTALANDGVLNVIRVPVRAGAKITTADLFCTGTAGTNASGWVALYNSAKALIGVSADQGTAWNVGGLKSVQVLSTPYYAPTDGSVYVAWWTQGSTGAKPAFVRAAQGSHVNANVSGDNSLYATADTVSAGVPPATLGTLTPLSVAYWVGLR